MAHDAAGAPRKGDLMGICVGTTLRVAGSCLALGALLAASASAQPFCRTYTTCADFNEGVLSGSIECVDDALQLSAQTTTFPVMWLANASEDSVSKWDTVANREWPSRRVGLHAVAELRDGADVLMAGVERQRPSHARVILLATPVVKIRAADVRERDLDQRRARLGIRHRILADLERLAGSVKDGHASHVAHPSASCPQSGPLS